MFFNRGSRTPSSPSRMTWRCWSAAWSTRPPWESKAPQPGWQLTHTDGMIIGKMVGYIYIYGTSWRPVFIHVYPEHQLCVQEKRECSAKSQRFTATDMILERAVAWISQAQSSMNEKKEAGLSCSLYQSVTSNLDWSGFDPVQRLTFLDLAELA